MRPTFNPHSQDPYETLADSPELLDNVMIRAFINDRRNRPGSWRPVHIPVERLEGGRA